MKLNKVFAAMAATALSVSAFAAMVVNAAEITLPVSDDSSVVSENAAAKKDVVAVITENKAVKDYVIVDFEVSGLNGAGGNNLDDGSSEEFTAYLVGTINGTEVKSENIKPVEGANSLKVTFNGSADKIDSLAIVTNIKTAQFTNAAIKVTAVKTEEPETTPTPTTTTASTTASTTTTTSGAAATSTAAPSPAPTGDAGVGVAAAALGLAAATAFVVKKKD
ncbi:MAG: NPXTG-anchored protein [Ruminococcus sp.]|nr:NPXTG-anchored protein [Ruminococcus sp.]